jgi:PhnB protein
MNTTTNHPVLQPYLFFEGRCEEAIEFYRQALDAKVLMLMRFKDSPEPAACAPGTGEKVMHASLMIGSTSIYVSDGRCRGKSGFEGFSLSLTVAELAEAERLFAALSDGGQVGMPLAKTFFSPGFGMVTDRFGVPWMVHVTTPGHG